MSNQTFSRAKIGGAVALVAMVAGDFALNFYPAAHGQFCAGGFF